MPPWESQRNMQGSNTDYDKEGGGVSSNQHSDLGRINSYPQSPGSSANPGFCSPAELFWGYCLTEGLGGVHVHPIWVLKWRVLPTLEPVRSVHDQQNIRLLTPPTAIPDSLLTRKPVKKNLVVAWNGTSKSHTGRIHTPHPIMEYGPQPSMIVRAGVLGCCITQQLLSREACGQNSLPQNKNLWHCSAKKFGTEFSLSQDHKPRVSCCIKVKKWIHSSTYY